MLVWACIAPHGGEVIPELAGRHMARMAATRAGMEELGRRCQEVAPDTIVVYTPHGISFADALSISVTERASGALDGEAGARIETEFEVDIPLALAIADRAEEFGVPVAQVAYLDSGEPAPLFPLDWGVVVPLWFMGAKWEKRPKIVVVCPSRALPLQNLIDFGRATAEAADASGQRVALIASADQGHGHAATGPYGFAPESAEHDALYCETVKRNALEELLGWDPAWLDKALVDSYWQTLMLHGATQHTPMCPELLSYEAPTYFGMACAEFVTY